MTSLVMLQVLASDILLIKKKKQTKLCGKKLSGFSTTPQIQCRVTLITQRFTNLYIIKRKYVMLRMFLKKQLSVCSIHIISE